MAAAFTALTAGKSFDKIFTDPDPSNAQSACAKDVANKANGRVIKKLVMNIPIKTISELKLKKVIGPQIVKATAVIIQTIMVAAL